MAPPHSHSDRLALVDALRAFALFGILQVNIQSFVWGGADPLGYLLPTANQADMVVYLLVSALVSTKFMALFAFLFGYGFALQMQTLRRTYGGLYPSEVAKQRSLTTYRRRLWFLLGVGVLHGCLVYFGDVLTAYALCGFILVHYAFDRPTVLTRAVRRWWLVFAGFCVLVMGGIGLLDHLARPTGEALGIPPEALAHHHTYTTGSYLAQLPARIPEYLSSVSFGALQYVPMVMSLFLLGALAARLGWLRYPDRHPKVWQWARRAGAAGLVAACAGASLGYITHSTAPGRIDFFSVMLTTLSLTTTALYVAWIVRYRRLPWVASAITWLAPSGRMPLTNYLSQSVLMGFLLSGWGLGLGATLGRTELALLACAIVVVQIMLSRVWIARFGAGPMETLWRQATYSRP
ncbi:MAG: hypothetical protein CFE44_01750 [Burkholderiales bacterium PBB4]|nr:MAG: hypothetical protein CFE44_01750 [Burkholderiales bacterium PBB4]